MVSKLVASVILIVPVAIWAAVPHSPPPPTPPPPLPPRPRPPPRPGAPPRARPPRLLRPQGPAQVRRGLRPALLHPRPRVPRLRHCPQDFPGRALPQEVRRHRRPVGG